MAPQEAAVAVVAEALAAPVAAVLPEAVASEAAEVHHVVVALAGDAAEAVDSHQEVSSDSMSKSKQSLILSIFPIGRGGY